MALTAIFSGGPARAVEPLRISVLTMGPGDPTFSKFGHDAIVVQGGGGRPHVYNFGTFSFASNTLFRDFLKGRLRYWLSVASLPRTLHDYERQNRSLLLQDLELGPEATETLARALAENALPENRYYLYDHFRDNCSTRVRDALDRATHGRVRRALDRPATMTYRDHALRLVADDWLLYFGLDLGLGPLVDRPITEWDEAFLPERLAASLEHVRVPSARGEVPFVVRSSTLFQAKREASRTQAPVRAPWLLGVGVLIGGGLAGLVRKRERWARIAYGASVAAFGTASGLLGTLLLFLWLATNNDVAHKNANAFLTPALALALVPLGIAYALGKRSGKRLVERALLGCLVLSGIGIVVALVTHQDIARTAALFVPVWLGGWLGTRRVAARLSG